MSIYTKTGDKGETSLLNGIRVSKSDSRIELLGTIDELSSAIGLAKVISNPKMKENLSHIQKDLIQIMAGVADPENPAYRLSENWILRLESQIDHMENAFPRQKEFVLYGGCELSARLDMARAIARRTERRFQDVKQNYDADDRALQYINRLSDCLYVAARLADHQTSVQTD